MNILLGLLALTFFVLFIVWLIKCDRCEKHAAQCEADVERIQRDAETMVSDAQALVDQHHAEIRKATEEIRAHFEAEAQRVQENANATLATLIRDFEPLRKYEGLREVETEAQRILTGAADEATGLRAEAHGLLERTRNVAEQERLRALERAECLYTEANALLNQAKRDATKILDQANERAQQIAGDAYEALKDKEQLQSAIKAMRNTIEGYGDQYLKPTRSILDDLADHFGHTSAGEALRSAREAVRTLVETGQAAACDYAEANRKDTAIRFTVDAFNGRVDAILSRAKHDNYGTLEQEIRDAYALVNTHGRAFRNAQILPAYLEARLIVLKWAVVVHELKLKEREEQRRIKEQMREEERARREFERSMRDAAADEERIRRAMYVARKQVEEATEEQRAKYEAQLQELNVRLAEAEARNQRALSMAQQTKRGHVYVISNIGSFGENVYKIGLTRRLEPMDRIRELGDSSVPFDFDVHALLFSENAPALEAQLHRHFLERQVNKVNARKKFFHVALAHIRHEIERLGLSTGWTMTAEATQYRESHAIAKALNENRGFRESWIRQQQEFDLLDNEMEKVEGALIEADSCT